jgi:excinuclease UvrABC nuclease subunit
MKNIPNSELILDLIVLKNNIDTVMQLFSEPFPILLAKYCIPKRSGCYIVFSNNALAYVGRSSDLRDRVIEHLTENTSQNTLFYRFTRNIKIAWLEISTDYECELTEKVIYDTYRPRWNKINPMII